MAEDIARRIVIVETSSRNSEEYERKRQELIKMHDNKRREINLRQLQEELAIKNELERERIGLLEKYYKRKLEIDSDVDVV